MAKISELPALGPSDGTEALPVLRGGRTFVAPVAPIIAAAAAPHVAAAENAAQVALAASRFFPSRAAGEAASTVDQLFAAPDGAGGLDYYRRTAAGSDLVTRALTRAALAAPDGSAGVGHVAVGDGARARPAAEAMDEHVYALAFSGYDPGGGADCYAAIMAADAVARARNRSLILAGTPLVARPIYLDAPTHWRFDCGHFKPGFLGGGSYLRKAASLSGPAIVVRPGAYATVIEDGGLLCDVGNGGDGVLILANAVTLRNFNVQRAGRDNIRIGGYAVGDPFRAADTAPTGINANSWVLDRVTCSYALRDGLSVDDCKDATYQVVDANAGVATRYVGTTNGRHGLYVNHSYLGSTFMAPLLEDNVAWGAYLDTWSSGLVLLGGDVEANYGGNVFEARPRANRIMGLSIQGELTDNHHRSGLYAPQVYGTDAFGSADYDLRRGRWSINGNVMNFWARVAWRNHSGAGSLYVSLPELVAPIWDPSTLGPMPVQVGLAGGVRMGLVNQGDSSVRVYDAATLQNVPLPTSGDLYMSGAYEIKQPVPVL